MFIVFLQYCFHYLFPPFFLPWRLLKQNLKNKEGKISNTLSKKKYPWILANFEMWVKEQMFFLFWTETFPPVWKMALPLTGFIVISRCPSVMTDPTALSRHKALFRLGWIATKHFFLGGNKRAPVPQVQPHLALWKSWLQELILVSSNTSVWKDEKAEFWVWVGLVLFSLFCFLKGVESGDLYWKPQ